MATNSRRYRATGDSRRARLALVLGICVGCAHGAPLDTEAYPPPGERFQVAGHAMHLRCSGTGSPVVVLAAGLGGTTLEWSWVQPQVARFTRVCSYDRAGYGWSERASGPRTAAVAAEELAGLLERGGVGAPLVLVGHSFGGLVLRAFVARQPEAVAGLILIDSSHEAQFERLERADSGPPLAPPEGARFVIGNTSQVPDGLPAELRLLARRLALTPDAIGALYAELGAMRWSADQVARQPTLPQIPLVVLAHDALGAAHTGAERRRARDWLVLQTELSKRIPGGRLLVVKDSGHHVHLDQPEVVVATIRSVVAAAALP